MSKTFHNIVSNNNSDTTSELYNFLQSGLEQLSLKTSKTILEEIITYVILLNKWNKIYNLTAISDFKTIIIRHIFDSLSIAPFISGPKVLDFGSGAGFPGLPLAIILPGYDFVLLDSSNKKTTFLNQVVFSLKQVSNVKVINQPIEKFHFDHLFATIVTRATAKPDIIIEKTSHLCAKGGQILVMQGKKPTKGLRSIEKPFEIYAIKVPYLNEERHIIRILN